MTTLTVISCGAAKLETPAAAYQLYTGALFRAMWRWATSVTTPDNIRVLSARHGLIAPSQWLDPYDQKMGQPGSANPATVAAQIPDGVDHIVAVGGAKYRAVLSAAARQRGIPVAYPFAGLRMGYLMQALKANNGSIPA